MPSAVPAHGGMEIDGPEEVGGTAAPGIAWALDEPAYVCPVQATIAGGRITAIDAAAAAAEPGVLAVVTHEDAPALAPTDDAAPAILQSREVAYRGQIVGGVIAETPEAARRAAGLVRVDYEERAHDVQLRSDRDDLVSSTPTDDWAAVGISATGTPVPSVTPSDYDAALASAAVTLDATYTTPLVNDNPSEPFSDVAIWADDGLTVYCGAQAVHVTRGILAKAFGMDPETVRVIAQDVGGASGSKAHAHPDMVLTVMAASLVAPRPVKLALTRRQVSSQAGSRTPTIERIEMGADADGRLVAIGHDSIEQTSMYTAPDRTTQRLAALNASVPAVMRAPAETAGMFALESAIDELAMACGVDPVEFRIRNEPAIAPGSGLPLSSRHLVNCLREGARRFGWGPRDPTPAASRGAGRLVGTGVAVSVYPVVQQRASAPTIRVARDGSYSVSIGAAGIGTGARTTLRQIAADALDVAVDDIDLQIRDGELPAAAGSGRSAGIVSWGTAIVEAATKLHARLQSEHGGVIPADGLEVSGGIPASPYARRFATYAVGAQFAEVRVDEDTGEIRVPRLLGVFDAGRVVDPKTGGSQLHAGMTVGLSMALRRHGVVDPRPVGHDLGPHAAVGSVEVHCLDEPDARVDPVGANGIGELAVVGTAAAIANAVHHATGTRVRELPITL